MSLLIEIVGWFGALLALTAYIILMTNDKVNKNTKIYQAMQLVAASSLAINAYYSGAWPLMALNIIWSFIAIYSLSRKIK